jgi:hypothetical protein
MRPLLSCAIAVVVEWGYPSEISILSNHGVSNGAQGSEVRAAIAAVQQASRANRPAS